MINENLEEQERKLEEMDYSPSEDIFNRGEMVAIDGDGNPITDNADMENELPFDLDIPGADDDDNFEQVIDQLPGKENSPEFTANDYAGQSGPQDANQDI